MEDAAWFGVSNPNSRINMVAATYQDARDTMVEGESGLLGVLPKSSIATWNRSLGELILTNATRYKLFAATEPDRLRGPQAHRAYCDELAAWQYPETFDQLLFGLRLGKNPKVVIATTPRPTGLLKRIVNDQNTVITRGSTFDNADNLAPSALAQLRERYEGTRLGRQELFAEILDDVPGALWNRANLDQFRARPHEVPSLKRIVVAIDPAVTSGEEADETGIVCAGIDTAGYGYLLEDVSGRYSPIEWARKAIALYTKHGADRVIAEVNNGGEMVGNTIRMLDPHISFRAVHATRGKVVRAEPVSALYEQGRISHVGAFNKLEDQLCFPAGTLISTSRGEMPIESVVVGDFALTRDGWRKVEVASSTGFAYDFVVLETESGNILRCTPNHPIWINEKFAPAKNAKAGDRLSVRCNQASLATQLLGAVGGGTAWSKAISGILEASCFIGRPGKPTWGQSRPAITSTMWMRIRAITKSLIYSLCAPSSMLLNMNHEGFGSSPLNRGAQPPSEVGILEKGLMSLVLNAAQTLKLPTRRSENSAATPVAWPTDDLRAFGTLSAPSAALRSSPKIHAESIAVRSVTTRHTPGAEEIFNLRVEGQPEYYANGILVHNCAFTTDFDRQKAGYSPDRLDALVWAFSELMIRHQAPTAVTGTFQMAG